MRLTPQQQAVVNHTYGPALVFAVAGAGKTTALEQRIVRLVQEGIFAPGRILAAAYNLAVKNELGARLRRHEGCAAVEVVTLHALGLRAVRLAWEAGLLPSLRRSAFGEMEEAQTTLLNAAMVEARRRKAPYQRELDSLDRTDFFTWLSSCKGNLFYPSLEDIPAILRKTGDPQQATPPAQTPWYLAFSQLMESVQAHRGLLTFDDQLRLGWEVLVTYPQILAHMQSLYDCVLVDEFQDVNLAQYRILDMITAPRPDKPQRNYMVVGDDDQTIYEWRGANTHFILNFGEAYKAARYVMSENFRCPAGPLTLANAVIRHNRQRFDKRLHLTRGLDGTTLITRSEDRAAMGAQIVATIHAALAQGDRLQGIAVLVRAKAQTPPVELALIRAKIPYEMVGGQPFYARWEITTLVAYCRMALFEQQLQGGKALSLAEANQLLESWDEVYRHPKRYISQADAQQIGAQLALGRAPISQVLQAAVVADKPHIQPRLVELATLLQWLSRAFGRDHGGKSAHAVLMELEKRLGYCTYLEQRGTRSESGVDEAENVKQFIGEAQGYGTLKEYLVYLKQLSLQQAAQQAKAGRNLITIRTIHSAKGLEWPVVILPSCDDDNIPHRKSDNVEEERRLLYVALTRSRRDLYIYHLNKEPSSFLSQAKWQSVLASLAQIRSALDKPPAAWSLEEWRALAVGAPQLGLMEYFEEWHPWRAGEQAAVIQAASAYFERAQGAGLHRMGNEYAAWQRLAAAHGVADAPSAIGALDEALERWLAEETQRHQAERLRQLSTLQPVRSANHAPASSRSVSKTSIWQMYDEVHHPRYGQGIVISTTTMTSGREIKVQFANGDLVQFRDDDPALARG
jgi:DNA helicase-2/ATP-dependent DNA helicase PcrA